MTTLRENWARIVKALACIERDRGFQGPLILMAGPEAKTPLDRMADRQTVVASAMIQQADGSTHGYASGHHTPITWDVRVDTLHGHSTLGLASVRLDLKMATLGGIRSAHVRLVSSLRHDGWTLETSPPDTHDPPDSQGRWKTACALRDRFAASAQIQNGKGNNLLFDVREEDIEPFIRALVTEADRIHALTERVWNGD